jgi:DNA-directed RNA polymerase specialized sigma24 family protein
VKYISQLKQDEKFGSWLFGIAHQKVLLHRRKQARAIESNDAIREESEAENENPSD